MPDALTTQLINSQWDDISKAMTDGLVLVNGWKQPVPALNDAVIITTEELDKDIEWPQHPKDEDGKWTCEAEDRKSIDIVHHLHLDYDALRSPDTGKIKDWAAKAREFERDWVTNHFVRAAGTPEMQAAGDLWQVSPAQGWGKLRCIVFQSATGTPIPNKWDKVDLDSVVRLDMQSPSASIQALVFRVEGGPFVRRPSDLSPGWMPTDNYGVDLVLTERLQIVNLNDATVRSLSLTTTVTPKQQRER